MKRPHRNSEPYTEYKAAVFYNSKNMGAKKELAEVWEGSVC